MKYILLIFLASCDADGICVSNCINRSLQPMKVVITADLQIAAVTCEMACGVKFPTGDHYGIKSK